MLDTWLPTCNFVKRGVSRSLLVKKWQGKWPQSLCTKKFKKNDWYKYGNLLHMFHLKKYQFNVPVFRVFHWCVFHCHVCCLATGWPGYHGKLCILDNLVVQSSCLGNYIYFKQLSYRYRRVSVIWYTMFLVVVINLSLENQILVSLESDKLSL